MSSSTAMNSIFTEHKHNLYPFCLTTEIYLRLLPIAIYKTYLLKDFTTIFGSLKIFYFPLSFSLSK